MSEYNCLDAETRKAVDRAVAECRETGYHISHPHDGGDVYAYPHGSGGIAWGVNSPETGYNIYRGVKK